MFWEMILIICQLSCANGVWEFHVQVVHVTLGPHGGAGLQTERSNGQFQHTGKIYALSFFITMYIRFCGNDLKRSSIVSIYCNRPV